MAFTIDGIIIDRIQMGIAEDFSNNILYTLTQLKDASVSIKSDSKDALDATGTLIKRFPTSKSGEFSATNAYLDFNIMAASSGSPKLVATAENPIETVSIKILKSNEKTIALPNLVEGSVSVVGIAGNGTKVADYSKDTAASSTAFSVAGDTITLPTTPAPEVNQFVVRYKRLMQNGVKVVNRADQFPGTIRLTLKVLAVDPCNADTVRSAYIVFPSFQVSPDVDFTINTDSGIPFNGVLQADFCGGDKVLYEMYFAEDDED